MNSTIALELRASIPTILKYAAARGFGFLRVAIFAMFELNFFDGANFEDFVSAFKVLSAAVTLFVTCPGAQATLLCDGVCQAVSVLLGIGLYELSG